MLWIRRLRKYQCAFTTLTVLALLSMLFSAREIEKHWLAGEHTNLHGYTRPIDGGEHIPNLVQQLLLAAELNYQPNYIKMTDKKRIAILTMYFGSAAELKPYTRANKLSYAEYHGYTFLDASEDPVLVKAWQTEEVKRNILQSKFLVLQHYMSTGKYDWLFWTDSDAVFLNRSRSLEDAGAVDDRFDMVVPVGSAFDFHWGKVVNTGHFSVRASPWGKRLAERAWNIRPSSGARCPAEPHGPLNRWLSVCGGEGYGMGYWLGDQGVFHALSRSSIYPQDFLCHIKFLNMRDLDSESQWYDDGDLIIHYPGTSNEDRIKKFKALNERADFIRGIVKDKSDILYQDLQDWRVRPGHFAHYVGVGWNVPCVDLFAQQMFQYRNAMYLIIPNDAGIPFGEKQKFSSKCTTRV